MATCKGLCELYLNQKQGVVVRIVISILSVAFFTGLFAASPAGIFKSVSGEVFLLKADKSKTVAKVGDKFFEQDTISTSKGAATSLIFSDNTLISIGSKSEFSIKEFLFEPSEKKVGLTGELGKGTMACITGMATKLNPDAMKIKAKTATIGIRGTYFVMEVEE